METIVALAFSIFFILILSIFTFVVEETRNYNAYCGESMHRFSDNTKSEMTYNQKKL